jgi:SAM-dependent methyltransferase
MAADATELEAVMLRLFLGGLDQPAQQVRAALGDHAVDCLLQAGILQSRGAAELCSPRLLVSCFNRHVLAAPPPGHSRFDAAAAPYCGPESLWFAQFLALRGRYGAGLDLCAGSGILAMLPDCESVVAVDIDPSALDIAAFNIAFNRRGNVRPVQGDLFDAVGGKKFDLITANPPFLPGGPAGRLPACGDGGRRGDETLMRILHGVADHLAPGGEAFVYAEGFGDRAGPAMLADFAAPSRTHAYTCWIGGTRNAQQAIFDLCRLWQLVGAAEADAWAHWRDIAAAMPVTHYHHAIWHVAEGSGGVAVRRMRQG